MKKLLLTLGTVAAVAAPVASVVACGTTNEVANPEFQAVSVKGLTFEDGKVPYLTTDFKGFVEVVLKTGGTYLVPANDIKEEVKTAAVAEVLDDKGGVTTSASAAVMTYTVVPNSVTSKDSRIKGTIDSVIKGKHTVLAEADQVKLINAGKPGEVKIYSSQAGIDTFLTNHISTTELANLKKGGKVVDVKTPAVKQTPFQAIAIDFYASTFKAADDAKKLADDKKAAITEVRGADASDLLSGTSKTNADLKTKKAELVKAINGAADRTAINLILLNTVTPLTIIS